VLNLLLLVIWHEVWLHIQIKILWENLKLIEWFKLRRKKLKGAEDKNDKKMGILQKTC